MLAGGEPPVQPGTAAAPRRTRPHLVRDLTNGVGVAGLLAGKKGGRMLKLHSVYIISCFKDHLDRGIWLAQSDEQGTLDLRAVSSRPTLV